MFLNNVLFVFKDKYSLTSNNHFWENKFKNNFNVFNFHLNDFLNFSNNHIIKKINRIIEIKKIDIVMFEGDHSHVINCNFINKISDIPKKGLITFDDMEWHSINIITAQSCDFVLTACPISALKFQEVGIKSLFVPIECDGQIFKNLNLNKIYDVIHFGRKKKVRSDYIDFLNENNINVKSLEPDNDESNTFQKLAILINQSKIVLNFSESSNGNRFFNPLRIFKSFYQIKGRIQITGLCNTLCLSQYSPANYLMYSHEELPSFASKLECLNQIKFYLENEEALKQTTNKFHLKSLEYEDQTYIKKIDNFLNSIKKNKTKFFLTPFWYDKIFINQTLRLRFKRSLFLIFILEFFDNLLIFKEKNIFKNGFLIFFKIFLFMRYFPFLILKKIFKSNKKFINPQKKNNE